jgi:hypothetical protein
VVTSARDFAVREVHTGGRPALTRRLRLDRAGWQAAQTIPVQIHGLPPCLPLFGPPADS